MKVWEGEKLGTPLPVPLRRIADSTELIAAGTANNVPVFRGYSIQPLIPRFSRLFNPTTAEYEVARIEHGALAGSNRALRVVEADFDSPRAGGSDGRRRRGVLVADLDFGSHGLTGEGFAWWS
jgi:hypothetical protein